jgi:hypothetical protein
MAESVDLPEGFQLDQLPDGFQLDTPQAAQQQPAAPLPQGSAFNAVVEPIAAMTGGVLGTIAGGVAGAAQALNPFAEPGAGAEAVKGTQESFAKMSAPTTQAGQEATQTLGDLMQKGVDLARIPLSGLAGLGSLLAGKSLDEAANTVKAVQEKGIGKVAGEKVMTETGSPLLATLAEVAPDAAMSFVPLKNVAVAQTARRSAFEAKIADQIRGAAAHPEIARDINSLTAQFREMKALPPPESGITEIAHPIREIKALPKPEAAAVSDAAQGAKQITRDPAPLLLEKLDSIESTVRSTAGSEFADKIAKIKNEVKVGNYKAVDGLDDISEDIAMVAPNKNLYKYIEKGGNSIGTDQLAIEANRQGFDRGIVQMMKGASSTDRAKAVEMTKILERGRLDPVYANNNRPGKIAGDTLLARVNAVNRINRKAGSELEGVAKSLIGKKADMSEARQGFLSDMNEMGITFDKRMRPNFKNSDIDGVPNFNQLKKVITTTATRLASLEKLDAYQAHRVKKFIDEVVTFGKPGEGVTGRTEGALKSLRKNIKTSLDAQFPEYGTVNKTYSETIRGLDNLQDSMGSKLDFSGPNANEAAGQALRRLMSNATSRVNMANAVNAIENIALKYGAKFDDSVQVQIMYANELDRVFPNVLSTSIAGEIEKGVTRAAKATRSWKEAAVEAVGKAAEKVRGINEENALKSITELLKRPK